MVQQIEELYCLLVPLHQKRLILPRDTVAEIIRYAEPDPVADMPDWFRGHIDWNNQRLPLVSFERLCRMDCVEPGGRTRIAVVYGITGNRIVPCYGVISEGFPQILRINSTVLESDAEFVSQADVPVITGVRMMNETGLIPDLEDVEARLAEILQPVA